MSDLLCKICAGGGDFTGGITKAVYSLVSTAMSSVSA